MKTEDLVKEYIDYCECGKRLSAHSVRSYRFVLEQFCRWTRAHGLTAPEAVASGDAREYLAWLNGRYAPAAARHHFVCVSAFFGYACECGYIALNPFRQVKANIRTPKRLPRSIAPEDLRKLLITARVNAEQNISSPGRYFQALRNCLLVELLLRTGMRIQELCNIRMQDLDQSTGTILVYGKGSKERRCYITGEKTGTLLAAYIDERKMYQSEYLFLTDRGSQYTPQAARRAIHRLSAEADVRNRITPHMFRHTFATILTEQGVELSYIQKYLGHSSISTTQIYLHISDETARRVLEERFPEV